MFIISKGLCNGIPESVKNIVLVYNNLNPDVIMLRGEIRIVERPSNSVVIDSGSKGIYRYAVIKHISCKVVNSMNQPVSGYTISHIINQCSQIKLIMRVSE
ncbi:MAG: hypothetical protein JJE21_07715, partial [Spirochaetaceae bacterium]|nr:hypothetical protein [Spirochaetaceae bacterium]